MNAFLKESFGYATASACALVVDITILWVLVHFLSLKYTAAAAASFLAGAVVAYSLSVKLAFKHSRFRDRRAEFAGFLAIGTIGLAVNIGVIYVMVEYLGLHYLIAKSIAAGFTFICNFVARRQLLFVRHSSFSQGR